MKRQWVVLTERQAAAVEKEAKERDVPVSEVFREMVTRRYALKSEPVEQGKRYVSPEFEGGAEP